MKKWLARFFKTNDHAFEIKPAFDYSENPRQFSIDYGELVTWASELGRMPSTTEILEYRRIRQGLRIET